MMEDLTPEQIKDQIEYLSVQLEKLRNAYNTPPFNPTTITASEGKIFRRTHDGFMMGSEIHLGYDYSLGFKRIDRAEFYEEIDEV